MEEEKVRLAYQGKLKASLETPINSTRFEAIPHVPGQAVLG